MNKALLGTAVCMIATLLVGCSGAPAADPPTASPSPVSTPSPTPSAPTKAEDLARLEAALVSAKDLGKPWVKPAAVSSSGKKGEICPGHRSAAEAVRTTASAGVRLTEGAGDGKNIGSFTLSMLPTSDASALQAAYAKDHKTCRTYLDGSKLYVVRTAEGPTSLDPADEVVAAWAERIYYDKAHRKLAYARHVVVSRTERVVTYVEYAFLLAPGDPQAKAFARVEKLASVQLTKVAKQTPG